MLQDYKLGLRMLLRYPGLTIAGGLALAVAIGIGATWFDLTRQFMSPAIPLPDGGQVVVIETRNTFTNAPEPRLLHDFLEWRRELKTIEGLGAFRGDTRNLIIGNAAPELIQIAELTAAAFATARVTPLAGRGLLDSDEVPGAPEVMVLGYDVWQRAFGGRHDAIGSVVKLGNTPVTIVGIMPDGFGYPFNHHAWTPLSLRASYDALEGGAISVIGRLAAGATPEQANAELRVFGERAAAALPATHEHLRPRVMPLGQDSAVPNIAQIALTNLPVLVVLLIACTTVGTLIYARTATREGEIAVRCAIGASRTRILSQLFVEALVLTSVAAAAGLMAADRAVTFVIDNFNQSSGGLPFWMTPGLKTSTLFYAAGLAVVGAGMLSLLPALKVTRARVQPHLANVGSGGATLRFGRVWTGAMIVQVALTAIGIPLAIESVNETARKLGVRGQFPSREFFTARISVDRPLEDETRPAFEERRARAFERLTERVSQETGVVGITFADHAPGSRLVWRNADVELAPGGPTFGDWFGTSAVGPEFFETFERPIISGRAFHAGDRRPEARTLIVNEAFVRGFRSHGGGNSPIGIRLRYSDRLAESSGEPWFEIVGVVRDFGLDPDDEGHEYPAVFHATSIGTVSSLVLGVRVQGNPGALAARLPVIAAAVDPRLIVRDAQGLDDWVRQQDTTLIVTIGAGIAVTALVLLLSAMGIFSLVSVSVSRQTREIGIRTALGAPARDVLTGILSRAVLVMGSGIIAGGAALTLALALGLGPNERPVDDIVLFAGYGGIMSAVMLAAGVLACIGPARRALRINPIDALREC